MKRFFSVAVQRHINELDPRLIRNIGVIAHIDAGKTTTTERMLYYVGFTKRIGNVDDGSTVTDYLRMERERGITIQSACIPLGWRSHRINLIDTPGHIDFTVEVERALRVLDGAVCIVDGVAGAEAQTETVWQQANRYSIPRICFVNKMDRDGAHFMNAVQSMQRLKGWGKPVVCQLPLFNCQSGLTTQDNTGATIAGVVDLVAMERLDWSAESSNGSVVTRNSLCATINKEALVHRNALIEALAEVDDEIINAFLEADGDHSKISTDAIRAACRRATIAGKVVPVFCGAAYRNLGVQPLLDAVIDYLPSPSDLPSTTTDSGLSIPHNGDALCALAFKVVYDHKRGPLVFVRVYSGSLEQSAALRIAGSQKPQLVKERAGRILELYADDYEEVKRIGTGGIGAVTGLKHVKTGDTLLAATDKRNVKLFDIPIPAPVFVRSCQAESVSAEKELKEALKNLLREDPSLTTTYDEDSGQTLIGGMGELHLEVAGDRLVDIYKVKCKLGKVEINYRETPNAASDFVLHKLSYDREVFGKRFKCDIALEMKSVFERGETDDDVSGDGNMVKSALDASQITFEMENMMISSFGGLDEINKAIEDGIRGALTRGPLNGYLISHASVRCISLHLYSPELSGVNAIRAAAYNCARSILIETGTSLLEPVMSLSIRVPNEHVGFVTKDISGARRGYITDVDLAGDGTENKTLIQACAPLSELLGYSTILRAATAGTGELTMTVYGYDKVTK